MSISSQTLAVAWWMHWGGVERFLEWPFAPPKVFVEYSFAPPEVTDACVAVYGAASDALAPQSNRFTDSPRRGISTRRVERRYGLCQLAIAPTIPSIETNRP